MRAWLIRLFWFFLPISAFAQSSQPMLAIDPFVGWNWKRHDFESIAEDKARISLHDQRKGLLHGLPRRSDQKSI